MKHLENTLEMGENSSFDSKIIIKEELNIEDELVPSEGEAQPIPQSKSPKKESKYRCEICDISFPNNSQRRSHVRIHKAFIFTCNICQKPFKERYLLTRHEKAHERSKEPAVSDFQCQHCDKVFHVQYLYKRHVRTHGPLPFKCSVCPKSFLERINQRKHEELAHNIPMPKAEKLKPNPDRSNYCEECDKTLKTRKSFVDHMRKHKYIKEGVFRCIPCDKSFGDNFTLVLHENREHHKNNADPQDLVEVQCRLCSAVFRSQTPHSDLSRHQKAVHRVLTGTVRNAEVLPVEPDAFCPEAIVKEELIIDDEFNPCEAVDDQKRSQSDSPTEAESYRCPVCDKSFSCNRKYYMHQRRHRDLAFTCSICQKSFKEKFELDRHAKQVHRERPKREFLEAFQCVECDKTFSLEKLFKNHVARHGARTFKCTVCPKAFALKSDLVKHEKRIHNMVPNRSTGEETESIDAVADPALHCGECEKFFTQRKTYLTHMRRHKMVKEGAFRCEPCQKIFSNNYELTLHVNGIQHKNNVKDPVTCEICQLILSSRRKLGRHKKEFHSNLSSTVISKQEGAVKVQQIKIEAESDEFS